MSLEKLSDGWMRFANGRIWRYRGPGHVVETIEAGHVPDYGKTYPNLIPKLKRIRSFYAGRVNLGSIDRYGTGLDVLVANAMTESYGTVPTPFSMADLKRVYDHSRGYPGQRLDNVLNYVKARRKWLVRKEPGYVDPFTTPNRVSVGAHHMLVSTGLWLNGNQASRGTQAYEQAVVDFVLRSIYSSPYAARMAVKYFDRYASRHENQPPLMAATYNAGSPRYTSRNPWNLVQYGDHIDRWISYFNMSRLHAASATAKPRKAPAPPIVTVPNNPPKDATMMLKVVREEFTEASTIGKLYINGKFHCYTLEDKYRPSGIKIYGETAIAEGRYRVIVNMSNRFKRRMPLLLDVPKFAGIRIHKGNTNKNTLGCILVGRHKGPDRIWDCSGVYNSLLAQLEEATKHGKVYITVGRG